MGGINTLRRLVWQYVPSALTHRLVRLRWDWESRGYKTTDSGIRFFLRGFDDWLPYQEVFGFGEYDRVLTDLVAQVAAGKDCFVVDLGANIGMFAMRLLDKLKLAGLRSEQLRYLGVEADLENYRRVRALFKQEGLDPQQWRLKCGLIGKKTGVARLSRTGSHFGYRVTEEVPNTTEEPYLDLEAFLPGEAITLLKCDIEGSEADFCECYPSLLSRIDAIAIETHSSEMARRCHRCLAAAGLKQPSILKLDRASGPGKATFHYRRRA